MFPHHDDLDTLPINRLRVGAYLAPGIPAPFFETIVDYLCKRFNLDYTSLIYESSEKNTSAHMQNHEIDLAWVSYRKFFELTAGECRLLPVSSVHLHSNLSQTSNESFELYSNVVIHSDLKTRVKEFYDLRGHRWAYTSPQSYSGHGITIDRLKSLGENVNFFGDTIRTASHVDTIEYILDRKCDAAAVDSNVFRLYLQRNPHHRDQLAVLTSWGPLPPYPIVVNSHISPEVEQHIVRALLEMHQHEKYRSLLRQWTIVKFAPNVMHNYSTLATRTSVKKVQLSMTNGMRDTANNGNDKAISNSRIKLSNPICDQFDQSPYY